MGKTRKCIKEFIECYRKMPFLWDRSHKDYRNRKCWYAAYKLLAEKLREIEPRADIHSVPRKIRSLRTAFRYQRRKHLMNRLDGNSSYKPTLWYYDLLKFTLGVDGVEKDRASTNNDAILHSPEQVIVKDGEYYDMEYLEELSVDRLELNSNDANKSENHVSANEIKNEFEGVCQCCLNDLNLKSMLEPHYEQGKMEVYAEMLHSVYSSFDFNGSNGIETQYLICDMCIVQLRAVLDFLDQVKKVQKILNPEDDYIQGDNELDSTVSNLNMEISDTKPVSTVNDYNPDKNKIKTVPLESKLNKQKQNRMQKTTTKKKETEKEVNMRQLKVLRKRRQLTPKTVLKTPFPADPKDLKCELCSLVFTAYYRLCRHMADHYPNFICDICSRKFVTWSSLRSHVKIIHENTTVKCEICDKKVLKTSLRRHMWVHTAGGYRYRCNSCPSTFTSHQSKMCHMTKEHGKTQIRHKCEVCYKDFSSNAVLVHHVKRTHLKIRNVPCDKCSKQFYSKSALRRHMIKHTGARDHLCAVCSKTFSSSNSLKHHMHIHNNVKQFACNYCSMKFTYKCILKNHLKRHCNKFDDIDQVVGLPSETAKIT